MQGTREQFLAARCKTRTLPAPELGEGAEITVVEPDDDAYEALESADYPIGPDGRMGLVRKGRAVRWAIATVRNGDGTPMFTDADTAALTKLPSGLLERVLMAGLDMTSGRAPVEDAAKKLLARPLELFAFRLAAELGILDAEAVHQTLQARGSLRRKWQAFQMLEPFGFPVHERRHVSQVIAAAGPTTRADSERLAKAAEYRPPVRLGGPSRGRYMTAIAFRRKHEEIGR